MARTCNPIRKAGVKRDLRAGIDAKTALMNNGYSDAVARKSTHNTVVKVSQKEILTELAKVEITYEGIRAELDIIKDFSTNKKDYATAVRCIELKGKMKGLFTDKVQQIDAPPPVVIDNIVNVVKEEKSRLPIVE